MPPRNETHYFLGANAPGGFYSLYDQLIDLSSDCRLYILKGGPGCGKSSFMRRIAHKLQKCGFAVEFIHCSGDPDSLDGVFFPELNVAVADGTAPHALEPKYPAAAESYIDLGQFYDTVRLAAEKDNIMRLNRAYKALYADAYSYIQSAGILMKQYRKNIAVEPVQRAIEKRARGIIAREIAPRRQGSGRIKSRFLSALTCKGYLCRHDTAGALADRIYVLDNDLFLADIMLKELESAGQSAGHEMVVCMSPFFPDRIEHLLFPALSLAFVSSTSAAPCTLPAYRHIRLDAIPEKYGIHPRRGELKSLRKLYSAILESAGTKLREAKLLHDDLEGVYNPHVDFDSIYALADKYAQSLAKNIRP